MDDRTVKESPEDLMRAREALMSLDDMEGQIIKNARDFVTSNGELNYSSGVLSALYDRGMYESGIAEFVADTAVNIFRGLREHINIPGVLKGPVGMATDGAAIRAMTRRTAVVLDHDDSLDEIVTTGSCEGLVEAVCEDLRERIGAYGAVYPYQLFMPMGPFKDPSIEGDRPKFGLAIRYGAYTV